MVQWQYYPRSDAPPPIAVSVVSAFEAVNDSIDSQHYNLKSNEVLAELAPSLLDAGFDVETGKRASEKIYVPVLFGLNGRAEKSFEADAFHAKDRFVLEVEAGRGVTNNQFLKDLFQACMMQDVEYLGIAVRNDYRGNPDFERVVRFFDTMYASNRLQLPLDGVLVIGY